MMTVLTEPSKEAVTEVLYALKAGQTLPQALTAPKFNHDLNADERATVLLHITELERAGQLPNTNKPLDFQEIEEMYLHDICRSEEFANVPAQLAIEIARWCRQAAENGYKKGKSA